MTYVARALEPRVRLALAAMPAVFINGPRQAGKSTLARHLIGRGFDARFVSFDDVATFAAASHDPEAFLRGFDRPVVIDEVQLVPGLFRPLKRVIDETRATKGKAANGRFLLTGSANVLALPDLADALVGRMAVLSLFPLSAGEATGKAPPALDGWFGKKVVARTVAAKAPTPASLIRRATFPEISRAKPETASLWYDAYITALLQRDIRQLAEIEKAAALPNVVKVLAARAGGLLNDADAARDAKLNSMTYRRYRSLVEQLFLIRLVPPWHRNIGKRLVKAPKLYFADTPLLCHQLGVDLDGLRQANPPLFGRVVENFVATELIKQLAVMNDGTLHHFRTHDHHEVDFVIERRNGKLIGIEVKAASAVSAADFTGLRMLKEAAGSDFVRGIVLYLGKETLPFGDDIVAMPFESLWTPAEGMR